MSIDVSMSYFDCSGLGYADLDPQTHPVSAHESGRANLGNSVQVPVCSLPLFVLRGIFFKAMKQATDAHAHLREMASAIQGTFQGSYEGNQIMHVNIPHVSYPESLPPIMSNTCCHHQAFFVQY
jgi:hypothetical protein